MRPLTQALHDHELIVLRVIGEWWELDLTGADKGTSVRKLAEALSQLDMVQEKAYLPPEEADAFDDLIASGGRIPVSTFERTHGAVRMMGPAALEREEPWFDPASPAEALWYRGFLYRGFDETGDGLIEFYYLVEEFLAQFPQPDAPIAALKAETAAPVPPPDAPTAAPIAAPEVTETAVTDAVDDMTTLLAVAQQGLLHAAAVKQLAPLLLNPDPERRSLLLTLAKEMGMLRGNEANGFRPSRTAVSWLQQSREQQLRALVDAWSSSNWNDLCHTPDLRCEGDNWHNDPLLARAALLDALPRSDAWTRVADLVAQIKENNPDFQRPDGKYDTWYVRDLTRDEYVTGFDNWDRVEGRLLPFLLRGPLSWLGMVNTGMNEDGDLCFQLAPRARAWLADERAPENEVRVPLVVQPDGMIIAPHNVGRYQRFQAARIGEALPVKGGRPFQYRITPASLARAGEEGISPDRIVQFLAQAADQPTPPSVKRAITRWGERGVEGRLETAVILRVRDAAILDTLRQNPKTRDYIGESFGDLAAAIRADQWQAFRDAVAQLGLLLESNA